VIKQNHEGDLRKQTSGPKNNSVAAGTNLLRNNIEQLTTNRIHKEGHPFLLRRQCKMDCKFQHHKSEVLRRTYDSQFSSTIL